MLKKLTIRGSLIGVVAALTLALVVTIGMSIRALSTMKADEVTLVKQIIPTVGMSNDLTAGVLRRHLRLNMHVNSTDTGAMTQLEADIRAASADLAKTPAELRGNLRLPQSHEALKAYEALVVPYLAGVEKVLDLSRKGEKAAAAAQLREMRETLASMEATLKQLVGHVSSRATAIEAKAEETYAQSFYVMLAIGLVSLLIAAGSIAIIVLRVTRPLAATTASMDELAKGNLDAKVSFTDRLDEIGTMARALQIFQENLQKVRALEAQEREASARRLKAADSMASIVSDVGDVVAAAAAGDFSARLQITDADPQMQKLVAGINEINAVVDSATTEFAQSMQAVAGGDLTRRIDTGYRGKFADLKGAINETVDRLSQTVRTIQLTSADVGLAAREINMGADDLSKRTEEQASSLEETAATTEELAASVKASAQASREAAAIADEAKQAAMAGGAIAGQAVDAMARIETASQKISDIIRVIDDIAFQTNLLALNAAVEAARAGDAGKGFAVVASEVRTLAQRSGEAAKDISALISSSNMEVGEGVKLVRQAGESLERILAASQKVAATIADISSASGEQANGIDEMSQAVAHLDEMTQQNAALAEQSAASAGSLSGKIGQLNDLVAAFRTGQDSAALTPVRAAAPVRAPAPRKPASEPERLRAMAETAFTPARAPAKKVANSRAGDTGWEEF